MQTLPEQSLDDCLIDVKEFRSSLLANGFKPVPVYSVNAREKDGVIFKTMAGKRPIGNGWAISARERIGTVWTETVQPIATNTGILCDGLRAIDVDVDDADLAAQIEAAINKHLGQIVTKRTREGSSRFLTAFRAAEGQPRKQSDVRDDGQKVEILGLGNQFVAGALHVKLVPNGDAFDRVYTPLVWSAEDIADVKITDLPAITEEQELAFRCEVCEILDIQEPVVETGPKKVYEPTDDDYPEPTDEDIEAIINVLPYNAADVYLKWWHGISAIKNSGCSSSLAHLFAKKCGGSRYDQVATTEKWKRTDGRPSFEYLIGLARRVDPNFITPGLRQKIHEERHGELLRSIARMKHQTCSDDLILDMEF